MIRPSSLPMVAGCPGFESTGSAYADIGTDRHAALKAYFEGDHSLFDLLDEESQAGIQWAAEYIRLKAPMSDHPIDWEQRITGVYPNLEEFTGTPDATCGPELFDFKWRRRDYTPQMCAYAIPMLEHRDRVRAHVLYGHERREEVFWIDNAAVDRILGPILESLKTPTPRACQYCGWCSNILVCPAHLENARAIHREDLPADVEAQFDAWCEAGAHTSQIATPELMSLILKKARSLKKFCDAAEFQAKEAATKQGWKLPGFELKEKQGKQFVTDTKRAYVLSGLAPDQFLSACQVRLNTSKKTGTVGLDLLFKEAAGSTAAAKRTIQKRLAEVITRGRSTLSLVSTKGEEETEGEE